MVVGICSSPSEHNMVLAWSCLGHWSLFDQVTLNVLNIIHTYLTISLKLVFCVYPGYMFILLFLSGRSVFMLTNLLLGSRPLRMYPVLLLVSYGVGASAAVSYRLPCSNSTFHCSLCRLFCSIAAFHCSFMQFFLLCSYVKGKAFLLLQNTSLAVFRRFPGISFLF